MKYRLEKYYPYLASLLITAGVVIFYDHIKDFNKLIDQLCDNAISLGVTLVGFFLTILTLVNAIETRRMRFVRDSGMIVRLLKYLKHSIYFNVILIGFSFLTKYVTGRGDVAFEFYGRNIWDIAYLLVFLITVLVSFRFTHIFVSLLADPSPPEQTP